MALPCRCTQYIEYKKARVRQRQESVHQLAYQFSAGFNSMLYRTTVEFDEIGHFPHITVTIAQTGIR